MPLQHGLRSAAVFEHQALQQRLEKLHLFRRQHEQLRQVVGRVLRDEGHRDITQAYEGMLGVDVLDVSDRGTDAYEAALKQYNQRIDRVEAEITARLRDQLGSARNANEMFRIFAQCNALFVRPRIRSAIQEYQSSLINRVKV